MRWGLAGWRLRQQRTHGEGRQQSHSRPRVAQAAEAARIAQEGVGRSLGSATAGVGVMLTPVWRRLALRRSLHRRLEWTRWRSARDAASRQNSCWRRVARRRRWVARRRRSGPRRCAPGSAPRDRFRARRDRRSRRCGGRRPGRRSMRRCTSCALDSTQRQTRVVARGVRPVSAGLRAERTAWPPFRWRREGGLALPDYPASISSVCAVEIHVAPLALTRYLVLQADVAARGRRAKLQRVDRVWLDGPLGRLAVARPARTDQRAAIVHRAADAMPQRVHVLRVALARQVRARGGVHLIALHARLQLLAPRLDGSDAGAEGARHVLWRLGLASPRRNHMRCKSEQ